MSGWLVLYIGLSLGALIGWIAGRAESGSVAWWEVSEAQRKLAEERERADEMAAWCRDVITVVAETPDIEDPNVAAECEVIARLLIRHDAARAAEVER